MNRLFDALLATTDRNVSKVGPVNKLVDAVMSRIAPVKPAAAACGSQRCGSYCGSNCRTVTLYRTSTGSCSCEVSNGSLCGPC